jgi:hypothetical protein
MKKLLLLLLCVPLIGFGQEKTFESFNSKEETYPKLVYKSYTDTDGDQTYFLAFYEDGSIWYQDPKYKMIKTRLTNNTFKSIEEIKDFFNDIKKVQKNKETIIKEKYAIEKAAFGSVSFQIKDIPKTYTFSKYAIKLFKKALSKF